MLKIGHRGSMGYEPENTLLSFKKAIKQKVDMIELDIHTCKSGELVVIHDPKVNRTTNGKGFVSKKTIDELKKFDAGKGETIPLLSEVLDLVNKKIKVNIELKSDKTIIPLNKLILQYINEGWNYNHFLISSFDFKALLKLNRLNPKIRIGIIPSKSSDTLSKFTSKIAAYSIHINKDYVSKKIVREIHSSGLKIFVWTVNSVKEIKRIKSFGVDGIFSNYPDRL
jgi:glycerophosphoryl diester phosphodiesterase